MDHTEDKVFTIDVGSDICRLYGYFQALWIFPGFLEAYSVYKVTQTVIPLVFNAHSPHTGVLRDLLCLILREDFHNVPNVGCISKQE